MNTHVRDNQLTLTGWTNHTPTLKAVTVDPTLSDDESHTAEGEYLEFGGGNLLQVFFFQFGTSGTAAGTGDYYIAPASNIDAGWDQSYCIGTASIVDDSASDQWVAAGRRATATQVRWRVTSAADTGDVDENTPMAWADSDIFSGHFFAEV